MKSSISHPISTIKRPVSHHPPAIAHSPTSISPKGAPSTQSTRMHLMGLGSRGSIPRNSPIVSLIPHMRSDKTTERSPSSNACRSSTSKSSHPCLRSTRTKRFARQCREETMVTKESRRHQAETQQKIELPRTPKGYAMLLGGDNNRLRASPVRAAATPPRPRKPAMTTGSCSEEMHRVDVYVIVMQNHNQRHVVTVNLSLNAPKSLYLH